jgi:hypothetical protein
MKATDLEIAVDGHIGRILRWLWPMLDDLDEGGTSMCVVDETKAVPLWEAARRLGVQVEDIFDLIVSKRVPTVRVLGEFGIGKSVLVNRLAEDAAAEGHWVATPVRVPSDADPVPLLAEVLGSLARTQRLDDRLGASVASRN